mmetsp:Transcript_43092/g.119184  ORF Transcript_43092/g.119184 Transcript_43092/m.119184 type:complete len:352 (+) Transcript_43092:75-1130(+)
MGCGLISQRGGGAGDPSAAPRPADAAIRQNRGHPVGHLGRHHGQYQSSEMRFSSGRVAVGVGARPGAADDGDSEAARSQSEGSPASQRDGAGAPASGEERVGRPRHIEAPVGRRFIVGERVVMTSRLPGSVQDHAFCFECGAFFQLGTLRSPQCSRCGSNFVQYLRGNGGEHWISAESSNAQGFAFDDQLDNSITASLDETPMQKKPTQGSFLKGLPAFQLSESEVQARSQLEAADPRRHCAICRDGFGTDDTLRRLPCAHEFHDSCIVLWLQGNNTCPICRCKMPEASDDEDDEETEEPARSVSRHTLVSGAELEREGREEAAAFLGQHCAAPQGLGRPPPTRLGGFAAQ